MKIHLNDDDCQDPSDRETAVRIISEIIERDVLTAGSFAINGYMSACRIARALTAARADERRRGFDTPMPRRPIAVAQGAPRVMAKWPHLRPLYHWLEVDGVRFQSYRGRHPVLISDDARIVVVRGSNDVWWVEVDDKEVTNSGVRLRFGTEQAALAEGTRRARQIDTRGW